MQGFRRGCAGKRCRLLPVRVIEVDGLGREAQGSADIYIGRGLDAKWWGGQGSAAIDSSQKQRLHEISLD